MAQYELAQLNVAHMKAPLESPIMADFVANLARINALAEQSAGFVWRLQTEQGDATALRPMGEHRLVNLSVWRDLVSLNQFVYRSNHAHMMRRRREWFEPMPDGGIVLWWTPTGQRPSVDEASLRLRMLREQGPTHQAFNFRHGFLAPDVSEVLVPRGAHLN